MFGEGQKIQGMNNYLTVMYSINKMMKEKKKKLKQLQEFDLEVHGES